MVERYLFVKLRDGEVAAREAIAVHVRDELRAAAAALGDGAGAATVTVTVGVPADDSAARWDLSAVVRVADVATWARIAEGTRGAALLDDWLPARAAVVKAWTFALVV